MVEAIKSLIIRIFHSLGYNLEKRKELKEQVLDYRKYNKPLNIEFMGASGVGKTTLFNELIKEREREIKWITPEEFIQIERYEIDEKNIFNSFNEEIIKVKTKIILDRNHSPSDKLKLLSFFYQNIKIIAMVKNFNKNYTVVFEDGLFHNFGDALMSFFEETDSQFEAMIANSAIIYCSNEPEIIAKQILKRRDTESILHPHHRFTAFEDLVDYQKKNIERLEKQMDVFKKFDIPIFKINTADDLRENAIKVNEIINSLLEEKQSK